MSSAPEPLRRAFADALIFLQEDIELQSECNQLAVELTERYEELNLVYSTKDQVEYFEEGQEALVMLVHNCADYLDVGLAALICRERGIHLHDVPSGAIHGRREDILELLATTVYDRVESQVQSVILNETSDEERARLFGGRDENLLAYPGCRRSRRGHRHARRCRASRPARIFERRPQPAGGDGEEGVANHSYAPRLAHRAHEPQWLRVDADDVAGKQPDQEPRARPAAGQHRPAARHQRSDGIPGRRRCSFAASPRP